MSDIIRLLPESLANQIAAGEVVQRPASVVKELLENAIDAKATLVQLIVKEAGRQLIQVIDNGLGMSPTDARMSFERHATSKLASTEDLFNIRTMGFRGEALASIAAVAQVELKTKQAREELGTHLVIEGSHIKSQELAAVPDGTCIAVKNLFFNVPARRNFLKSNAVELRHVVDEFQRVALANPAVSFVLYNNDLEVFNLPGGKLSQRIVGIFGPPYKEQLARCEEETSVLTVKGYIGKPEFAKKSRGEQFFFVNGRYIKSNYLHHAVVTAYEGLLPKDSHPFYVLFLTMDPRQIDINVHPTKTEIKFEDERTVYAVVRAAVKMALGQHNITPSIDFEQNVNFSPFGTPPAEPDATRVASPPKPFGGFPSFPPLKKQTEGWEALYEGLRKEEPLERQQPEDIPFMRPAPVRTAAQPVPEPETSARPALALEPVQAQEARVLQLHNRYIVTQVKSGLMLIDQQAALERIHYEKYRAALNRQTGASQQLLFPQVVSFSATDFSLLMELQPELKALGFDLSDFGNRNVVVQGVPTGLTDLNEKELLEGLLEQFKLHQSKLQLDRHESLARAMARRVALKPAPRLSVTEMTALVDQLFACQTPTYAPSGKKTLVMLDFDKLTALFD